MGVRRHAPETRAAAVAAVATGERPSDVAKRFGISQGILHGWCEKDLPPVDLSEISRSDLARARSRERIAELIYDCTASILTAIQLQLQGVSREEWLAKQNAGDLAALLDKELDGAIRLLAGFRTSETEDDIIDGEPV